MRDNHPCLECYDIGLCFDAYSELTAQGICPVKQPEKVQGGKMGLFTKQEKKKAKKLFKKWRPDKNKVKLGDGSTELSWKLRPKKVQFKLSQEFEDEVEISISCKVTGDLYKFKKPKGLEAKFEAVKKVSF